MGAKIAGTFVTIFIVLGTAGMLLTNFFTKLHHELPDSDQPLGWIAIASCVFAFGSYGVFIKTPAVSDLVRLLAYVSRDCVQPDVTNINISVLQKVDPGVFQVLSHHLQILH